MGIIPMNCRVLVVWLTIAGCLASELRGDTIYVDDDACPSPGTGTQLDPYCAIQTAIDAAKDFDEILVAPGTYNETIDFLGKAIALRSTGGRDVTTIDGTGLNDTIVRCVSGEGPDTILEGFKISNGLTFNFGGMSITGSSPTVKVYSSGYLRDGGV